MKIKYFSLNKDFTLNAEGDDYAVYDADFTGEQYEGEAFVSVDCSRVTFGKMKFTGCNFCNAIFVGVKFIECDFSNTNFKNTYFKECEFTDSKFIGVNFSENILRNSNFKGVG